MSRNMMYALVALFLVIIVGLGGGYWAIKKIRDKRNQEYKYQVELQIQQTGVTSDALKAKILTDKICASVIKENDLLNRWNVADEEAAKKIISQKLNVIVTGTTANISYQDKDKELSKEILADILELSAGRRP